MIICEQHLPKMCLQPTSVIAVWCCCTRWLSHFNASFFFCWLFTFSIFLFKMDPFLRNSFLKLNMTKNFKLTFNLNATQVQWFTFSTLFGIFLILLKLVPAGGLTVHQDVLSVFTIAYQRYSSHYQWMVGSRAPLRCLLKTCENTGTGSKYWSSEYLNMQMKGKVSVRRKRIHMQGSEWALWACICIRSHAANW